MMDIPKAKVIRINKSGKNEEFEIDNTKLFDNEKEIKLDSEDLE